VQSVKGANCEAREAQTQVAIQTGGGGNADQTSPQMVELDVNTTPSWSPQVLRTSRVFDSSQVFQENSFRYFQIPI
jgi:hypothetical protein